MESEMADCGVRGMLDGGCPCFLAPGDPQKAKVARQRANAALIEAGVTQGYTNQDDLARAWARVVGPIAKELGIEIGAIFSLVDGRYYPGEAYSNGSPDNVTGLLENARYVGGGKMSGYIHTHPKFSLIGVDRAFAYGDFPVENHGNLIGGTNLGGDIRGDLVSAYYSELSAYIVEPEGIRSWNYSSYVKIQRQTLGVVKLGEGLEYLK